jgi:hypothetical protein
MHEPIHQTTIHPLVAYRLRDRYAESQEVRRSREVAEGRARSGLVTRTRRTIGYRLIAIGSTVAGHQASGTQTPRRHAA